MDPALVERLLASIAAHRLTIVVGAGLSMSPPSELLPAWRVAEMCFDAHVAKIGPLTDDLKFNLEGIAEHVKANHDFRNVFIRTLVPWPKFVAPTNEGHAAIADFLLTGAAAACLSANYDTLIENVGTSWGADLQSALAGDEATEISAVQSPLLKFHGCMVKDRDRTVWTPSQFDTDEELARRRVSNVQWMEANLQQKDLLIAGFWSDWAYLNAALDAAMPSLHPRSITIVDPSEPAVLEEKAPTLWNLAHQPHVNFTHVQLPSHIFFGELRNEFSKSIFRQVMQLGNAALAAFDPAADPLPLNPPGMSNDEFYAWRRDTEGRGSRTPAVTLSPDQSFQQVALVHALLRRSGAVFDESHYMLRERRVRVVNGAGRILSEVRKNLAEGPAIVEPDVVVCAGALDLAVPNDIVRSGEEATLIRPGSEAEWLPTDRAIGELGL